MAEVSELSAERLDRVLVLLETFKVELRDPDRREHEGSPHSVVLILRETVFDHPPDPCEFAISEAERL